MRIAIAYPPIRRYGKYPLLSQNRQFRYSSSNQVRIFPLVPASAATLLQEAGHQVLWLDGINERMAWDEFEERLVAFQPDLTVVETKAPMIRGHWRFVDEIKERWGLSTALVGDHICVDPEETIGQSKAEYAIAGGDFDIILAGLVEHLANGDPMPAGVFSRENGRVVSSGPARLSPSLDDLPFIDRELTKWHIYGESYLYHPCAYVSSGRGCGGGAGGPGRCAFCIWQHSFWKATSRLRSPRKLVREIKELVQRYKVREIFDDNESGGIWNLDWLRELCHEMQREGLVGRVVFSSNARGDSLTPESCRLMKETGFRLLKVGLESANNETLRRLNKGETIEDIVRGIKTAKDHGLAVLITTMTGYPWETEEDAKRTCELTKELMLYKTQRIGNMDGKEQRWQHEECVKMPVLKRNPR